jgi:hypothetical protein
MDTPGQAQMQHKSRPHALALHGAGGGGWEFNVWRARLRAAGWTFDAPDLQPGDPIECTRLQHYREQVQAVCGQRTPQLLIGASLGGLLALLAEPPTATAVTRILINPLPPAPWHNELPQRVWPERVDWAHRHDLAGTRRALGHGDPVSAVYAQQRWRDESGAVLREAWLGVACPQPSARTLVIAGALDQDVPVACSRQLAAGIGADYLELAGAGHIDPLTGSAAQPLLDQVLRWLAVQSDSWQRTA